jgi:hypothetical protein
VSGIGFGSKRRSADCAAAKKPQSTPIVTGFAALQHSPSALSVPSVGEPEEGTPIARCQRM